MGGQGVSRYKNIVPPEQVEIPHKKPKGKSLSTEQKQENNVISSFRIVIEHAIGGIKDLVAWLKNTEITKAKMIR